MTLQGTGNELEFGNTEELHRDAAATVTPVLKLSVSKCQAHMGAPTPSERRIADTLPG